MNTSEISNIIFSILILHFDFERYTELFLSYQEKKVFHFLCFGGANVNGLTLLFPDIHVFACNGTHYGCKPQQQIACKSSFLEAFLQVFIKLK